MHSAIKVPLTAMLAFDHFIQRFTSLYTDFHPMYTSYAPNFEKVGSILVLARPCVRPCVCASLRPFKKIKLGF